MLYNHLWYTLVIQPSVKQILPHKHFTPHHGFSHQECYQKQDIFDTFWLALIGKKRNMLIYRILNLQILHKKHCCTSGLHNRTDIPSS